MAQEPNTKHHVASTPAESARTERMDRRAFLATASSAAFAFSVVPRHALGGPKHIPPSEKINVAYIGAGTKGIRQLLEALPKEELKIVSVCDPNRDSNDYVAWGRHEIRDKVRRFLNKPHWGFASMRLVDLRKDLGRSMR